MFFKGKEICELKYSLKIWVEESELYSTLDWEEEPGKVV
jgi:hypothetical protein